MPTRRENLPVAALCVAAVLVMQGGAALAQPSQARLRPPPGIDCPRDQLTLYAGAVVHYRRGPQRTEFRIRTDWGTTESAIIKHPGTDDPSRWFLIEGQAFAPADWGRIEQQGRKLRTGVRAAAWVCNDGRNPVVDWNPPLER